MYIRISCTKNFIDYSLALEPIIFQERERERERLRENSNISMSPPAKADDKEESHTFPILNASNLPTARYFR